MPARRSTAKPSTSSGSTETSPQTEDPNYKLKRKKNNEAVQRTREKTKKTAEERKLRIDNLKNENLKLRAKIDSEKQHIKTLREMIVQGKKNEEQDRLIDEILNKSTDDEDDEDIKPK
ncbi:CCAAT/enhancer-binding protein homolog 2 [Drosophila montana]|uniref:CCAAT/enhancer-binding protein homolog 2 n=1 Tax=Drosophila montana TaxID=40370 RepID=UPI00313D6382